MWINPFIMKRQVLALLMMLVSGVLFAQATSGKEQIVKIKNSDKSKLKMAESNNGSSVNNEKSEPVIIQTLEFKNPDASNEQVQPTEAKAVETKVEKTESGIEEK